MTAIKEVSSKLLLSSFWFNDLHLGDFFVSFDVYRLMMLILSFAVYPVILFVSLYLKPK